MRRLRDNSLTIALMALFGLSFTGHIWAGWNVANTDAIQKGQAALSVLTYSTSPEFLSSVFENWESEFLQMATYVVLTALLFQRGSAESKDPDQSDRDSHLQTQAARPQAPSILRWGRLWRALYARSLGISLLLLFGISFVVHWTQSAQVAAKEMIARGETPSTTVGYLANPQLWFESFQNWQSEFLSTAVLVVLSIFLRQRESPESKAVAAPHAQTGT